MKKTILILSAITVISFTGCSKAEIEKNPVSIEEVASLDEETESDASNDGSMGEENTKATEVKDSKEENGTGEGIKEETNEGIKEETKGELIEETKRELIEEAKGATEGDVILIAEEPTPVTFEIEGMQETMYCLKHVGDGYEIMYDMDRFEYLDKDGVDTLIAENPDPAIYPYVFLSIKHLENKSSSDYAKELSDILSKNGLTSEMTKNATIGKYKGTIISAQGGLKWNSVTRDYYIIEDGSSIYVIESQGFLEASEGYGARIHAMLKTFEIK